MTIQTVTFDKPKAILLDGSSTSPTAIALDGVVPLEALSVTVTRRDESGELLEDEYNCFGEFAEAKVINIIHPGRIYYTARKPLNLYAEGYTIEYVLPQFTSIEKFDDSGDECFVIELDRNCENFNWLMTQRVIIDDVERLVIGITWQQPFDRVDSPGPWRKGDTVKVKCYTIEAD